MILCLYNGLGERRARWNEQTVPSLRVFLGITQVSERRMFSNNKERYHLGHMACCICPYCFEHIQYAPNTFTFKSSLRDYLQITFLGWGFWRSQCCCWYPEKKARSEDGDYSRGRGGVNERLSTLVWVNSSLFWAVIPLILHSSPHCAGRFSGTVSWRAVFGHFGCARKPTKRAAEEWSKKWVSSLSACL